MKFQFWMVNIIISHLQGRAWGVWEPNTEFHDNIKIYRYNKFLNIGESRQIQMWSLLHNVASGLYPHFLWLFKDILPELRTHFTFHDHLLAQVEDFKQSIRGGEARTVIFVGVHCRRTDYAHHYKVVSGGTLVDRTFFDAAFAVYRERYNDQQNKVVFLAVSDDPKWMKVDFSINLLLRCP